MILHTTDKVLFYNGFDAQVKKIKIKERLFVTGFSTNLSAYLFLICCLVLILITH